MYKKQRRHALKVDSSSASERSNDSDPDCHIFMTDKDRSLLKTNLRDDMDRNLLIGILDRKKGILPKAVNVQRGLADIEDSDADSEDKSKTVIGP